MRSAIRACLKTAFRRYPFFSGGGTLANAPLPTWATANLGSSTTSRARCGAAIVVNPQECLGRAVYYTGDWDPKVTWVIERLLRDGDTFIDIGAHCGITAVTAARRVGVTGHVHAFEPQPALASMMRESAMLNGFSHLHVHNIALSDEPGDRELFIDRDKPILASLERPQVDCPSIKVLVANASKYLCNLHIDRPRLIKIDVEGHEESVLKGAHDFLSTAWPGAILFESVSSEGLFWQRPAVAHLSRLGYQFLAIPRCILSMRTAVVEKGTEPAAHCHDFVAVRDSSAREIRNALNVAIS